MIERKTIAHAPNGMGIDEITLSDGPTTVKLLTLGAVTRDWTVAHQGGETSVVLGYEDPLAYVDNLSHMGAIAGRIVNRVAGGKFEFDGQTYQCAQNEGSNMLHGGNVGIAKRHFTAETDTSLNGVVFHYHSPDGEEGFPGAVDFTYVISLDGSQLTYELRATSDRPTPINLAQHNYYNLMGQGDIRNHHVTVAADKFTPSNDQNIPTGEVLDVTGTQFDFRSGGTITQMDPDRKGIDINLVLQAEQPVAAAVKAANGLNLTMRTNQPAVQLYTGQSLFEVQGLHGQKMFPFSGLCLEPQHFPNAVNEPKFVTSVATPDKPYYQKLSIDIKEEAR